jgi:glycosyltransferase involved in cell wall biosynthesis
MTLYLVQDVPTPHNSLVARELEKAMGGDFVEAYAFPKSIDYGFRQELIDNDSKIILTGGRIPHLGLMLRAMLDRKALWIVVGWSNPTSRALIFIFCVLRRQFVFWMDQPLPENDPRSISLRGVALLVLRRSKASIAAVGLPAVRYFTRRGFQESRVRNIPVVFARPVSTVPVRDKAIERWLGAPFSVLFASRLVVEKGADILVRGLSLLPTKIKRQIVLLIVGRGPEEKRLRSQTQSLGLQKQVMFLDWAEYEELVWLADCADLIVAPSRFDSYGGAALLAMISGKPFIASDSVGAAIDFINRGVEVPLFPSGNAASLAGLLNDFSVQALNLDEERKQLNVLSRNLNPKKTAHDLLLLLEDKRGENLEQHQH